MIPCFLFKCSMIFFTVNCFPARTSATCSTLSDGVINSESTLVNCLEADAMFNLPLRVDIFEELLSARVFSKYLFETLPEGMPRCLGTGGSFFLRRILFSCSVSSCGNKAANLSSGSGLGSSNITPSPMGTPLLQCL